MKRQRQIEKRQHVLQLVHHRVKAAYKTPSYESMVQYLNRKNIPTSRGNPWTRKALFRFLQNAGYSGLWGLSKCEGLPVIRKIARHYQTVARLLCEQYAHVYGYFCKPLRAREQTSKTGIYVLYKKERQI